MPAKKNSESSAPPPASGDGTTDKGYYKDDDDEVDVAVGAAQALQRSPRSMYADYVASNRYATARRELPTVRMDDHHYSSTAIMLKKTKAEIEAFSNDLSVLNTIVELPVTEEVRRTVARIFADPRNSKELSEAEWKRREQAYLRNKEKFSERFNEQLDAQRTHMTTEMSRLGD